MTSSTLTGDALIARRHVAAPIKRVWAAFTTPADLAAFWGGSHAQVPEESIRVHLNPGGDFELRTRSLVDPDAGRTLRFRYDVVEPPERLMFTEVDSGLTTTISLAVDGRGTLITVHQRRLPPALRTEQARRGLASLLDALAHHLTTEQS